MAPRRAIAGVLTRAGLSHSVLAGTALAGAVLLSTALVGATFVGATLAHAVLMHTAFTRSAVGGRAVAAAKGGATMADDKRTARGGPGPAEAASAIDATSARQRAREAIDAVVAGPGAYDLTPPLPLAWPPAGDHAVAYFAFTRRSLPSGAVRYAVASPAFRVDVVLTAPPVAAPRVTRLQARDLGTETPTRVPSAALGALPQAEDLLVGAVARGRAPESADAERIRASYLAWVREHRALATEVRTVNPAFFDWLDPRP
ncbi:MAG TPA: hypothetical protein VGL09_09170 [Methylomirabilota bacterium]|jgi:hypothetical protein